MKISDLYREWARVLDMCEGTNVDPGLCWMCSGVGRGFSDTPGFTEDPESYSFAVAILEGKPVFVGDELYGKYSNTFHTVSKEIIDRGEHDYSDNNYWSWQPPKKTFALNGEELPCPVHSFAGRYPITINGKSVWFSAEEDRNKVADAIIELLKDATK